MFPLRGGWSVDGDWLVLRGAACLSRGPGVGVILLRTHCRLHMDIHGQGKRVAGRSAASSQHTLIVSELASSPPTSRHR